MLYLQPLLGLSSSLSAVHMLSHHRNKGDRSKKNGATAVIKVDRMGFVTYCGGNAADVLIKAFQADRACGQLCLPWRRWDGWAISCCTLYEFYVLDIQQPAHDFWLQRRKLQEA